MRFILTPELGRLLTWLRVLGLDAVPAGAGPGLVIKSLREDRVILTRGARMSRFSGIRMVRVESEFVEDQLTQIMEELGLEIDRDRLFTRCVLCNDVLIGTDKESVRSEVPEYVFETQSVFTKCPRCGKIYWQGTHLALVEEFLKRLENRGR